MATHYMQHPGATGTNNIPIAPRRGFGGAAPPPPPPSSDYDLPPPPPPPTSYGYGANSSGSNNNMSVFQPAPRNLTVMSNRGNPTKIDWSKLNGETEKQPEVLSREERRSRGLSRWSAPSDKLADDIFHTQLASNTTPDEAELVACKFTFSTLYPLYLNLLLTLCSERQN